MPANLIPDGLARVYQIVGVLSRHRPWASDEGIAVPCEHKDSRHYWELPEANRIGEQWAREKGYELVLSAPGHILESMVTVAGGLLRGRWFANVPIVKALRRMAQGKVISLGEFHHVVETANDPEDRLLGLAKRHLEYFEEKGILRLCMKVQCPHCRQYPWYTLEELAHEVECRRCLRRFSFPVSRPPVSDWGYRSVGPFASPQLAQGAYSPFLALRFLTHKLEATTTCVPSCKLRKGDNELEVDFICFWCKPAWRDRGRHVILGECKCFGEFQEKDIRRMQEVARCFPDTIIAFCTLKSQLDSGERRLIRRFAESGRNPAKGRSWPVPVLVLTANELCVTAPGPFHRGLVGDQATGLAQRMPPGPLSMLDLCSASQQEYLGLNSWQDWIEGFYKKKARRLGKSKRPPRASRPPR